ncbi:DNA-binding transcriptional MerR regulator [Paenibacillus amylolyticus]|uniref:DNA-binding transcriptional MerR regulator n=1 Tax=Paenibacillus amylolyticus TaxID=1451 RepID=A0AAP5H632_PAEAM|nr:MerR family transcriptional regulator [Paenibacillus amylolyticus]MDR6725890.1 DNA-binding transcriptional MerR regulator [Paenibacillus amylolyticus]
MKINEVSKRINLPISTLRYYEKVGIITEEYVLRDQNNYRIYTPGIIQHLEVVKQCLAVGFTIQDIESMISKNGFSESEQIFILKEKISEIEEAQLKLEHAKQSLNDILRLNITCEDGFGKH